MSTTYNTPFLNRNAKYTYTLPDDCRPYAYVGGMGNEILSQDEIDTLISRTQEIDPAIPFKLSNMVSPQMIATVKTMLNRYHYALTHRGLREQHIAKENLRQAAFKLWLNRYGFINKSDYMDFVNKELRKRGLNWKLGIR